MTTALKLCFGILLLWFVAVQADVSHLGYRRYRGERLRLQRLESEPTPYPAAGYRPNREFSLPRDQPLFPLANQHNSRPFGSSGFNNLGDTQRPQLTYGSPQPEPRFRPQNRPQKFNTVDEPQEQVYVVQYETSQRGNNNLERPHQPQNFNNDFSNEFNNNFAGDQPAELESQQPQNGFNNLGEPQQPSQQPDSLYGAPNNEERQGQSARLRQQLIARLQQAERLEKQQQAESQRYRQTHALKLQSQQQSQQQFLNAPQSLYTAPVNQIQAESQTSRLVVQKPARLTDNREETELETDVKSAETEEIETTTKSDNKKVQPQTVNVAAATPNGLAQNGIVTYYPAGAVSFVQPFNAAYLASSNYQTLQPVSAAYAVGSPYLPQQYALAGAPAAQLQAW